MSCSPSKMRRRVNLYRPTLKGISSARAGTGVLIAVKAGFGAAGTGVPKTGEGETVGLKKTAGVAGGWQLKQKFPDDAKSSAGYGLPFMPRLGYFCGMGTALCLSIGLRTLTCYQVIGNRSAANSLLPGLFPGQETGPNKIDSSGNGMANNVYTRRNSWRGFEGCG